MQPKTKRGKNPKSLANLRPPWKPGEVPNPLGVNRKRPWTERYAKLSESPLPEKIRLKFNLDLGEEVLKPGASWAEASTIRRMLETLEGGGTPAAKEIVDRIEGKSFTYEEERVDAKEAHVYLVVSDDKRVTGAKRVVGNVEITGVSSEPDNQPRASESRTRNKS